VTAPLSSPLSPPLSSPYPCHFMVVSALCAAGGSTSAPSFVVASAPCAAFAMSKDLQLTHKSTSYAVRQDESSHGRLVCA
jgi:hypothetical protein